MKKFEKKKKYILFNEWLKVQPKNKSIKYSFSNFNSESEIILARAYIKFESLEKKDAFLRGYKPVFIDGKGEKWNPVVEEALFDFFPTEAGEPNPLEGSYERSIYKMK